MNQLIESVSNFLTNEQKCHDYKDQLSIMQELSRTEENLTEICIHIIAFNEDAGCWSPKTYPLWKIYGHSDCTTLIDFQVFLAEHYSFAHDYLQKKRGIELSQPPVTPTLETEEELDLPF